MKKPFLKKKPGLKPYPKKQGFCTLKAAQPHSESSKTPRSHEERKPSSVPKNLWEVKYQELEKQHRFLQAEYANYKKQTQKKIEDLKKYDGQFVIQEFLNRVQDDFDRALNVDLNQKSLEDFKKGVQMIYNNFQKILKEAGVQPLDVEGKAFDPAAHIAIGTVPHDQIPVDHIARVIKKAYVLHGKLIRPAEVLVSQKPEEVSSTDDSIDLDLDKEQTPLTEDISE